MAKDKAETLPSAYEVNTRRSELFGYVLLAGLGVELLFAIIQSRPWADWFPILLSDALIVIGVWGEIHFGRKARVAGDAAQAEANARAEEANRLAAEARERTAEIELITSFRRVSHAQLEKIREALSGLIGRIDLLIEYQYGDVEAFVYARDLTVTFTGIASIRSVPNSYPGVNAFGLFIAASSSVDIEVVAKAFVDADIEFSRMHKDLSTHLPRNVPAPNLYIFVAPKPPPSLISPAIPPKQSADAAATDGAANASP